MEYENQFDRLASCIALFQVQAGRLETFNRSATEALGRVQSIESQSQAALDRLKKKIDVAEQAAETSALSTYASYFDKESDRAKSRMGMARGDSRRIRGHRLPCLLALGSFRCESRSAVNDGSRCATTVMKVVVLSTAFTLAVACSRIYRSHRHNFIVNRHRRNALRTFQAFANAPEADAQTKSAVLLEATKCIFSQQATVYISSEQDAQPSQILEIVRQLNPK